MTGFMTDFQITDFTPRSTQFWKTSWTLATQVKGTQKEKAPANKTSALSKIMNMDIWEVGKSNHLLIGDS